MFPRLSNLPKSIGIHAIAGAAYGYAVQVNPKLAACAFALRPLANGILFAIANPLFGGDLRIRSLRVNQVTSVFAATIYIIALQQLQMIALKGTLVLVALEVVFMVGRCHTIWEMEKAGDAQII